MHIPVQVLSSFKTSYEQFEGIKETNNGDVFNNTLFLKKATGMLVYGCIYEIQALMIFKSIHSKRNVFIGPVMGQSQLLIDITYLGLYERKR